MSSKQYLLPKDPFQEEPERPRYYKSFRDFKGVNTKAYRTAIPENNFGNLENLMPIGPANIHSVPDISAAIIDYAADIIYARRSVDIGGVEFIILFATNGKVFAFNVGSSTSARIDGGLLLSGSNSRCDQWKNSIVVFIDSTGYYSWDGVTFAKITGAGVPSAGNDIAVYAGRVWIVNGRVLSFSAVDDYLAAAWGAGSGTGFVNLTDSTLRSTVTRLFAGNGYLYFWGITSINIISDVRVPAGASPPVPIFTNLNIHAIVGTDQPFSVFVWGRSLMFATRYGAYRLDGVNVERVSEDIDGTWQYADFSQGISGGSVQLNNILCAAFCLKINDPILGIRTVLPIYFDKKWFFGNMGTAVTFIEWAMVNGTPTLFGMIGNKLYQLFSNNAVHAIAKLSTALWAMEDNLLDKESFVVTYELVVFTINGNFTATIDTERSSITILNLNPSGAVTWINNSGNTVIWQNNALATVTWTTGGYFQLSQDATNVGKYIGTSLTSSGANFQLNGINLEYKLGARY